MNITLIGMPGSGKSTYGKRLAKSLKMKFVDVDDLIHRHMRMPLNEIIEKLGDGEFLRIENEVAKSIDLENHIIATGGSVPLTKNGMKHLKSISAVVYINVPVSQIKKRRPYMKTSHIVGYNGEKSFDEIYKFRKPYYEKYADFTFNWKRDGSYPIFERLVIKEFNLRNQNPK